MQMDAIPNMLDSLQPVSWIFQGHAPDQAVHFVALGNQQLGKIRSVLARNPRD